MMQWVAAKTGLKIQFVNDYSWQAILEQFNVDRLDMVHSLFFTDQRAEKGRFSDAYATIREYVITHQTVAEIQKAEQMESLTFALVKGWKNTDYLLKHFKQLKFKLYDDTLSRMMAVNKGEADALIGNADTFARFSAQYQLNNLKLNRPIDELLPMPPEKLRVMVQPEYEALMPLINRALASITDQEYRALKQRWQLNQKVTPSQLPLQDQLFYHVLNQLPAHKENKFYESEIAQQSFLSAHSAINFNGHSKTYLAVFVPKSTLMAPFNQQWMISIWVTSAVLLLILWLTHYSSNQIVQPIRALIKRNQLIEQRQFDKVTPVETNIKELNELSQTLMKVSDSFQTYERKQDSKRSSN